MKTLLEPDARLVRLGDRRYAAVLAVTDAVDPAPLAAAWRSSSARR
jgi:hypothetical protein